MAEFVVSGVAERLGKLLLQEANFLSGVSHQVEMLQNELKLMQSFLKVADTKQDESDLVRQLVAQIRDLAYDAEDIIATYALKVGSRGVKRCACILGEGITVHQVGSKVDVIKTRISNLKQCFQDYGIEKSTIQAGKLSSLTETQREQRQTFSHPEHDVVGFNDGLNKLVNFLLKEEGGKRVASICGMGGLGKTTLAKMVYNNPKVKQHFNCCSWVYISQQCQRRPVLEEILINLLSQFQKDEIQKSDEVDIIKKQKDEIRKLDEVDIIKKQKDEIRKLDEVDIINKLYQVQFDQKRLVVLDDIWNEEAWNKLREAFPKEATNSKILLTSRNQRVCQHVDPGGFHYQLQHLNDVESLELLEKIAISGRKDCVTKTKTNVEKFGKRMIGYCGGLPLAIIVLGGLLAAKQTPDEWGDVLGRIESYHHVEQNLRVNEVLALSYYDLPCHLKPYFLYLGHFPEDFEIPTRKLIRMWMGEGFISQIQHEGEREDTMDDVGDRYLRELVQRCMVLVGKRGLHGRIKTCRMHDLMRDFCISKAQEENFLHFTNILSMKQCEVQIGKVRRLAIIPKSGDNYIEGVKFKEYPYLRSLLHFMPSRNYSQFKESCFKKFKLVRVLYLENFNKDNKKLPKDIGCLIHLRYLSLKDSNINKVPSSIGNLRCLETIDLRIHSDDSYEPIVPNVFKYMKQLKHLYLPYVYRVRFELELSNLSYLQSLVSVDPKTIQIPTWFKLNRLQLLKVRINKQAQDATQILQILISRCPHLEMLNIFKPIKKLPEAHQFSPYLFKLILWGTNLEADPMATLEKLPNLKLLRLFGSFFQMKNMVCSERGFLVLQTDLVIGFCDNLEQWRVEEGAMPSLNHLTIDSCQSLKTIPDELRFITTLKELEIKHMPKSFKDRLHEGGPDFYKVQHVQRMVIR